MNLRYSVNRTIHILMKYPRQDYHASWPRIVLTSVSECVWNVILHYILVNELENWLQQTFTCLYTWFAPICINESWWTDTIPCEKSKITVIMRNFTATVKKEDLYSRSEECVAPTLWERDQPQRMPNKEISSFRILRLLFLPPHWYLRNGWARK